MELLNKKLIETIESGNEGTCLSLYMPTHRSHPDNVKDPINFKNLVKSLEDSLLEKYSSKEVIELIQPFESLLNDKALWNHSSDGLAVFSSGSFFKTVALPVSFEAFTDVANFFYTKPLRKYLQSVDRFHILGISLHDMQLFEGNRHGIVKVDLPDKFPTTIETALGDDLTDKHLTVTSHGGVGGESGNMHHGHGSKKDEVDIDAERFFRKISREIQEQFSKPSGLPLILATLTEHHSVFQGVSNNPLLLPNGIQINYKAVSEEQLAKAAWEVMEPEYFKKLNGFAEAYRQAEADKIGSANPEEVAKAAAEGRVKMLLLEEGKQIGGTVVDKAVGTIKLADINEPEVGDLLYDIGALVTSMGGEVVVIPKEKMPVDSGLAAIYRY